MPLAKSLTEPAPPIVQKHDLRRFIDHMLMNGGDIDVSASQGFQYALKFGFEHREIALDDGFFVATGKYRPSIDAHRFTRAVAVHLGCTCQCHFINFTCFFDRCANDRFNRLGIQ
jgi:hypothetical protein